MFPLITSSSSPAAESSVPTLRLLNLLGKAGALCFLAGAEAAAAAMASENSARSVMVSRSADSDRMYLVIIVSFQVSILIK